MHNQAPQQSLAAVILRTTLVGIILFAASDSARAQSEGSSFVRLFRLEGTFGSELPVKTSIDEKAGKAGFTLAAVRLEADQMMVLTRVRSFLTLVNGETGRRITEAEWRLDVYDVSLRNLANRVLQSEKVKIYAGETGKASANFGALLPDRMVVLFQLARVSFDDGSAWVPAWECTLEEDLRTVSCKSK